MHLHPLLVTAFTEECSTHSDTPVLCCLDVPSFFFVSHGSQQFISAAFSQQGTERRMPVLCFLFFAAHLQPLFCFCLVESEQKKIKESRVHCLSLTCSPLSLLALTDFLWNCSFGVGAPHTRQKQQKKSYVFMIILQRKKVWRRRPIVRCPAITEPCVTNQIQSHLGFFFRICSST